jgi:2-phosphosulfolactate phosphatase
MAERRFEWGVMGARRLAPSVDVLIVVDVLSFSTSVDIATAQGATVYPTPWNDERAAPLAEELGAVLAVGRSAMSDEHPYSLSPASLTHIPAGTRLVLPSPNGATIAAEAAERGATVIAGCMRNATAVATSAVQIGGSVGVVAAGERWPDASLRPALEDAVGAGLILGALGGEPSPDALSAIAMSRAVSIGQIAESASAQELFALGFGRDVELALMTNASTAVSVLADGGFRLQGS